MNGTKSPYRLTATQEQLNELKRLLAAASASNGPDALRPVLEFTLRIHSTGSNENHYQAQA